jgi:hypothetical protein
MIDISNTLLKTVGLSKISHDVLLMPGDSATPVKGQLLGMILPSQHFLAIVGLLDETLKEYIINKNVSWPKDKKQNLKNRIDVVSSIIPTLNLTQLQCIRLRRNEIAHEPNITLTNPITWDEYDQAVDNICSAVRDMGFISEIPNISSSWERTPTLYLDELGPEGERIRFNYLFRAKLDEEVFMEYRQTVLNFPLS